MRTSVGLALPPAGSRLVNPNPDFDAPAREGGARTQVSRLGMPRVSENGATATT
jgi:hypothetical protein